MKRLLLFLMSVAIATYAMDDNGYASIFESLASFENRADQSACNGCFNRPGYVKPIITNLGNVLNSNWYASASVPKSFVFEAGLPISLIFINNDDKEFSENETSVPTIFGTHGDPLNYEPTIYGNKTLNKLPLFTYPYIQFAASYYHTRLVLRGMWLPPVSELQRFDLLGFGLQYMLPPSIYPQVQKYIDISFVFGYNNTDISYQPEDYQGSLDLDISAFTFDLVVGYKPIDLIEIMLTLGYQSATMDASGKVTSQAISYTGQSITPNISVDGNCGFKFGLEVAFQIGASYHPVVGFDYSNEASFTTNILYFKQQFGEDPKPKNNRKSKINKSEESEQAENENEELSEEDNLTENSEEEIEETSKTKKKKKKKQSEEKNEEFEEF